MNHGLSLKPFKTKREKKRMKKDTTNLEMIAKVFAKIQANMYGKFNDKKCLNGPYVLYEHREAFIQGLDNHFEDDMIYRTRVRPSIMSLIDGKRTFRNGSLNFFDAHYIYTLFNDTKYFSTLNAIKQLGKEFYPEGRTTLQYAGLLCFKWRRLLALGARCSIGINRQMYFKSASFGRDFIRAKAFDSKTVEITVDIDIDHVVSNQLRMAFEYLPHAQFAQVSANTFHLRFSVEKQGPGSAFEPLKNTLIAPVKHMEETISPVEEYFAKKISEQITEITCFIDEEQEKIDVLKGKVDKFKAQRAKLYAAHEALTK